MEETLQSYERTANRGKKWPMETNQRAKIADSAPSKPAQVVRAIRVEESDISGSDPDSSGSKMEQDRRRIYAFGSKGHTNIPRDRRD